MLSTRKHFKFEHMYRLKVNGWLKIQQVNANLKKAEVGKLISDRSNIKARKVIRNKKG